jgi:hypothetical protein
VQIGDRAGRDSRAAQVAHLLRHQCSCVLTLRMSAREYVLWAARRVHAIYAIGLVQQVRWIASNEVVVI